MEKFITYKQIYFLLVFFVILLLFYGCKSDKKYFDNKNRIEIKIHRFDNELYNLTTSKNMNEDVRQLYKKYEEFMPYFVENIIGIPVYDTNYFCKQLQLFLNDTIYGFKETNKRVNETFSNMKPIQKELNDGFSKINSIFPQFDIPEIYFYISGFNSSISFINNNIGLGSDMYLGEDYPYYNRVVHNYQKKTMRPDCITVDIISAFLFKNIPFESKKNRLLENMIYRGKIMFMLTKIFQKREEYDIMGYTQKQHEWCKKNESNLWNFIVDKKELFQTNNMRINSYLNDGPFTSEISQECPARIGTWIGLQIVKKYMNKNDISMVELINNWDAENILYNSKYRP